MSTELAWLRTLVQKLEEAGIPYMVAGSLASSFFGEPRTTNDIDVVIDPTPEQLEDLILSFGEGYYLHADTARQALAARSMFNVIDHQSGLKADFIIRKDRPFSREEFQRRHDCPIGSPPADVALASAEDVILSKLEWAQLGDSERQYRDAVSVAVVNQTQLDWPYLENWAVQLGVKVALQKLRSEIAGPG